LDANLYQLESIASGNQEICVLLLFSKILMMMVHEKFNECQSGGVVQHGNSPDDGSNREEPRVIEKMLAIKTLLNR